MTTQELQIAKLRYLLYEAIVELEYVQASEDHSLCASAKGREIVERGMKLLEVKDLSQEHLVGAQEEKHTVTDPLKPSASLLVKLGSIAIHAEEMLSPKRHQFDLAAMQTLLDDVEVRAWVKEMDKLAFLPVKR